MFWNEENGLPGVLSYATAGTPRPSAPVAEWAVLSTHCSGRSPGMPLFFSCGFELLVFTNDS